MYFVACRVGLGKLVLIQSDGLIQSNSMKNGVEKSQVFKVVLIERILILLGSEMGLMKLPDELPN